MKIKCQLCNKTITTPIAGVIECKCKNIYIRHNNVFGHNAKNSKNSIKIYSYKKKKYNNIDIAIQINPNQYIREYSIF